MTKSGLEMEHTMGSSDPIRKHDCILNVGSQTGGRSGSFTANPWPQIVLYMSKTTGMMCADLYSIFKEGQVGLSERWLRGVGMIDLTIIAPEIQDFTWHDNNSAWDNYPITDTPILGYVRVLQIWNKRPHLRVSVAWRGRSFRLARNQCGNNTSVDRETQTKTDTHGRFRPTFPSTPVLGFSYCLRFFGTLIESLPPCCYQSISLFLPSITGLCHVSITRSFTLCPGDGPQRASAARRRWRRR